MNLRAALVEGRGVEDIGDAGGDDLAFGQRFRIRPRPGRDDSHKAGVR